MVNGSGPILTSNCVATNNPYKNQLKRIYDHMLSNLSLTIHFYSVIQNAYRMRDANICRSQKKTILPPRRNNIFHPQIFQNQHTLIWLIQLKMYVECNNYVLYLNIN